MSVYNPVRNVLFVHIPRTGGTSIECAWFLGKGGHETVRDYPEVKDSFKFSFVRNPWDRFVSAYFIQSRLEKTGKAFNEYIDKWCRDSYPRYNAHWIHFMPMHYFLLDEHDKIGVDFIGRFENLLPDWASVCAKLEVKYDLPHYREGEHDHYKSYYTSESWEIIGNLYARDVELFGYTGDKYE